MSKTKQVLSPLEHSNYWHDLAQRRLAKLDAARSALEQCRQKTGVRGKPYGDGHFGIGAIARRGLKESK